MTIKRLFVLLQKMPRKAESQTEETTLRRSTRAAAVNGNAGTPSSVRTRRGSLLAQENDEDNVETKATPKTRRGEISEFFTLFSTYLCLFKTTQLL